MPNNEEKNEASMVKKPLPLWGVLALDVFLIAACLLSFAYFHHVNPIGREEPDISAEYTNYVPKVDRHSQETNDMNVVSTENGADSQSTDDTVSGTTDAITSDHSDIDTTNQTEGQSGTTVSTSSGTATGTLSKTTVSTTASTSTQPKIQPDLSGWGAKWPDKFSYDDSIIQNDTTYKSHDLNITLTKKTVGNSVAFVADIYERYYDNFMYAFGHDTFSRSASSLENMSDIAGRKNAVLAFNGDFYGQRDTGMLVRAGKVWRDVPKGDVACYYYDGSFRGFTKDDFDLQKELSNGLYHTMTFGPILVQNGVARTNIQSSVKAANPRTGFGYYEPGHYVAVVVDGRQAGYSEGLTLDEFAAFFDELGCKEAYNLDGGASSVMYFNGKIVNKQSASRSMSDIFYFGEVAE